MKLAKHRPFCLVRSGTCLLQMPFHCDVDVASNQQRSSVEGQYFWDRQARMLISKEENGMRG